MRFFWIFLWLAGLVHAQPPIHIPDDALKVEIEDALWVYDPSPADMLSLVKLTSIQSLNTQASGIRDLTGLEYAVNLQRLTLRLHMINDITPLTALTNLSDLNLSRNVIPDISPLSQLTKLTKLNLHGNKIDDASPLRNLSRLTSLDLHWNEVEDISPLKNLTNLRNLWIHMNRITDVSPLSGLTKLESLYVGSNQVADLSPLKGLLQLHSLSVGANNLEDISICAALPRLRLLKAQSNRIKQIPPLDSCPLLEDLRLEYNRISDISELEGLENLHRLYLNGNPLSDQAYQVSLNAIARTNPGIALTYDPCTRAPGQLSAAKGSHAGRVRVTWDTLWNGPNYTSYYRVYRAGPEDQTKAPISPWQTGTLFDDLSPEPGKAYRYWVRTALSLEGDAAGDYGESDTGWLLDASSTPLHNTLYVDCNVIADANQTGSLARPFGSIQAAIDTAIEGDCIMVRPGTYFESIDFRGKNLTVTGLDPCEPNQVTFPVLYGDDQNTVVQFAHGEDPNCTLEGFIISQGNGAILCDGSSPTITHCLIAGNRSTDPNRGAVTCWESHTWLNHCTIADNTHTGLLLLDSDVLLTNCIVWNNQPEEIVLSGTSQPWIMYTNTSSLWEGPGNIHSAPLFARPGHWDTDSEGLWIEGDYHLQSETGRWAPDTAMWVVDAATSPCIDAADPNAPWIRETEPHGSWANMGVYGNTPHASRSD